jgi:hypothetical protein
LTFFCINTDDVEVVADFVDSLALLPPLASSLALWSMAQ